MAQRESLELIREGLRRHWVVGRLLRPLCRRLWEGSLGDAARARAEGAGVPKGLSALPGLFL